MKRLATILAALALLIPISSKADVRLEEVYAKVSPGLLGDANRNGVREVWADEFVEIINNGFSPVNISGWLLTDESNDAFVFPPGTIINPGERLVVFGSGDPAIIAREFRGIKVFLDDGSIGNGLNDTGDTVFLFDNNGNLIDLVSNADVPGGWDNDQSIARDESGHWVQHEELPGVDIYSPGIAFRPLGDVTGNGRLSPLDASWTLRYVAGLQVLGYNALLASDVSGDRTTSSLDASLILQFLVGQITEFP